MNQSIPDSAAMLPSDFERQQIFYWLRRVSSVTAWRRLFEFYRAWATATENSLREADEHGWGQETSLPQSEYALILKCLAHCEEGVSRLEKGDKRVFKFDANGEFAMARRMLSHWTQMLERIELGENGIKENTPLWAEFCEALISLGQAWGECAMHILEPRYLGEPGLTLYGAWLQAELKTMPFPQKLMQVPDPIDNTFVRTNDYTPCSGIWEPVDVPKPSLLSLITRAPKPQPPFKLVGAMNYLHGGSKAPRIMVETASDNIDLDTTWRLLWRDDRYTDGTVPEEEAHYRFNKPDAVLPPAPLIWVPKETIWAESGAVTQVAGKWLVETDLSASVTLQKGEKLPLHQGLEVRWVLADN
ncbi:MULTISPECIES: Imm71 family immunity protein [unclassified Duganella]|uniref:Imm71 family immunity protein n=1 Tax=unclassified Duganella TaxID=2636909 RepID=UPI001E2E307B|nr:MULTISPECIES: Imm71 family immunity protein [unclassified Duganella]